MSPHPSAFALDTYAALAEPPADHPVRAHCDGCDSCRAELDATIASRAKFRREVFPRTLPAIGKKTSFSWLPFASIVPVLAAAAFVLIPRAEPVTDDATPAVTPRPLVQAKGSEGLEVVLRRGQDVRRADPSTTFLPGDELRFVVFPGAGKHALLVGLDVRGQASVYAPFDGQESLALADGPRAELPGSIVLDATPGPERLFLLLSKEPILLGSVKPALDALAAQGPEALRKADRLALPDGITQVTRLLEKPVVVP